MLGTISSGVIAPVVGTNWTTKSPRIIGKWSLAGAGVSSSALSFGGVVSGFVSAITELFS